MFEMLFQKLIFHNCVDEAVEVNTFHRKDHSYSLFLTKAYNHLKYFNGRSSK